MYDALQPAVLVFFVVAAVAIVAAVVGLVIAFRDSRAVAAQPVVSFGGRVAAKSDVRRAA